MTVVSENVGSFGLFDQLETRIISLYGGYIHRKLSDPRLLALFLLSLSS
jgi:hypothetical protein